MWNELDIDKIENGLRNSKQTYADYHLRNRRRK